MKWALLFFVLSSGQVQHSQIMQTFALKQDCIQVLDKKIEKAKVIRRELGKEKSPKLFLACLPYTGPWKQEVWLERK